MYAAVRLVVYEFVEKIATDSNCLTGHRSAHMKDELKKILIWLSA